MKNRNPPIFYYFIHIDIFFVYGDTHENTVKASN